MTTTTFQNPGLIPLEAITTVGVSVKEGDNPIGFFGTGLKIAIAVCLRLGHEVTIYRGLEPYVFGTQKTEIRGKDFDLVTMNGEPLGFTTHFGAQWEPWQAFRELYSNTLDEKGWMHYTKTAPAADRTTIHVTGEALAEAARNKAKYFLDTQPLHVGSLASIHPGRNDGIYYRGIMVATLDKASAFTYNLTYQMTLTEDRTLKYQSSGNSNVAYTWSNCEDASLIRRFLAAHDMYEGTLPIYECSQVFAETTLDYIEEHGLAGVSSSARVAAETWAKKEARVRPALLSPREQAELEDAKAFLAKIGYPITAAVTVADNLGANVFGMAVKGQIFIAKIAINRGGNFLIGTLLEEQLHLTHGFEDESRRFQDFLIDLVVKFAKDATWTAEHQ
jgi:hypothetical protein